MDTRISSWCSASGPCPDGNSPVGSEVINSEWGSRTSMSTMREETVESERTVIISEREGSENYPAYLLREEVDAAAHKVHPYRIPVIGWKDDLRAITRDDLSHHYQTYYHPNNAVAVAVGPFDAHAVMEAIKQAFAGIPPGSSPPRVRVREPQQEGEETGEGSGCVQPRRGLPHGDGAGSLYHRGRT